MMPCYCHIDSSGGLEYTNLQLYSLQQAAHNWNDLIDLVAVRGDPNVDNFRERLVFILSCLGLSLSQLLGQNCPSPEKEKMANPGVLLGNILNRATTIDRSTRGRLNSSFKEFLSCYAAIRHFGVNKDARNHRIVDQLTLVDLDRFRCMTIEIWDVIISLYRKDKRNEIDDFRSVSEVVRFRELVEPGGSLDAEKRGGADAVS